MTLGDKIVTFISLIVLTTVSVAGFELAGVIPRSDTIGPFNHGERLVDAARDPPRFEIGHRLLADETRGNVPGFFFW